MNTSINSHEARVLAYWLIANWRPSGCGDHRAPMVTNYELRQLLPQADNNNGVLVLPAHECKGGKSLSFNVWGYRK